MITLLLTIALCVQQDDPVADAEKELQTLLKKSAPLGMGVARDYLEVAGQHAARQFGGKEMKRGLAIMAMAFEGLAKGIKDGESKSPDLRKTLLFLERAKKRVTEAESDDQRTVAYRFAIDRITLMYEAQEKQSVAFFNKAMTYLSEANYPEAEELLTEAEALLPDLRTTNAETTPQGPRWAAILLGHALGCRGKYKEAAAALRRGLAASPEFVDEKVVIGKLHAKEGEYEKAVGALAQYLKLNNDDKDALLVYAFERFFSERRGDAKDPLQKLLLLDGKDAAGKLLMEHLEEK